MRARHLGRDLDHLPGEVVINAPFDVGSDSKLHARRSRRRSRPEVARRQPHRGASINLNEAIVATYAIESSALSLERVGTLTTQEIVPAIKALPGVLEVHTLGAAGSASTSAVGVSSAVPQGATLVRMNGSTALAIQVVKRGDANTLDVADRVADAVKQSMRATVRVREVELTLAQTQSDYIRAATGQTLRAWPRLS